MKTPILFKKSMKAVTMLFTVLTLSLYTIAQEVPEKVEVDIDAGGSGGWFGQPWVWAVGVAIFIIILVVLTRGSRSSNNS